MRVSSEPEDRAAIVPGSLHRPTDREILWHAEGHGIRNLLRVFNDIAQLRMPERVLLYALIHGIRPRNVLEVGSAQGGSAYIIAGALDDNQSGRLVCIDPEFRFAEATWEAVRSRAVRIGGRSPAAYAEAQRQIAPECFDFVFLDGDHRYEALVADIEGLIPLLADRAHLLLHDSNHPEVSTAIADCVSRSAGELLDCGDVSIELSHVVAENGDVELWGGLRLLRFVRKGRGDTLACGTPASADESLAPSARSALHAVIARAQDRIRELETQFERAYAEGQAVARGFEERGARVRELEDQFTRLWEERCRLAAGFEERGARIRELEAMVRNATNADRSGGEGRRR